MLLGVLECSLVVALERLELEGVVLFHPFPLTHAAGLQMLHLLLEVLIGGQTCVAGIVLGLGDVALLFLNGLLPLLGILEVCSLDALQLCLFSG